MAVQREYELTVLGRFRITSSDEPVFLRPVAQRLIALLAITGPQGRTAAACALWPDLGPPRSASNLRTIIWRLRRDQPGLVQTGSSELQLGAIDCDLEKVRDWANLCIAGEQRWPFPKHASSVLLPGWDADWLSGPREELRVLQMSALELSAQRFLMSGRLAEACGCALAAVTMDPLRESATRLLIEIHLREGNSVDALRLYHRFCRLLHSEIGVAPGPAVRALAASIDGSRGSGGASLRRVGPPRL